MASVAPERRHPSIYLLGDHLDAALAMGEDLLTEKVALDTPAGTSPLRDWMRQNRDLNDFLATARTLEYAMTARLLQARKRAEELKRGESRLRPLIALFVAGTAPLADAAAEFGDTDARDFQSADAALTFLRSRGLIAQDAAGLEGLSRLAISEDYQIAGRIRLGTLLDLIATFLDTLDLLFDLYAEPADAADAGGPRASETAAPTAEPSPVA
ncbi:MAG: hypothetical protein K2X43_13060 [Hyphomonadaceae bacterium]|nr:hypothetical protein [Hyphomonadaceae bacterium]